MGLCSWREALGAHSAHLCAGATGPCWGNLKMGKPIGLLGPFRPNDSVSLQTSSGCSLPTGHYRMLRACSRFGSTELWLARVEPDLSRQHTARDIDADAPRTEADNMGKSRRRQRDHERH